MAQIISMTTRTLHTPASAAQLAAFIEKTELDIADGTHEIGMTLIDQRVTTVISAINKFKQLYTAGKDRQTSTDDAIAAARAGEL